MVSADAIAIESTTTSAGNQVTWTLPITTPDEYDVYARWGSSNSGASDAKYTITHAGGADTVTVDQTTAYDGSWIKLGTYDLAPDAGHKVTLSDRANGQVAADAIRIVSASGGERVARWQGSVAGAGTYQVWARWTAAPSHAFAATYRVTTPGGTDSVTVDQRSGGGQWRLLKTLSLAANDNWQVELSDQTPGEVVADAIAVTPPISLADRFEWAPTLPAAGDYAVYAKWQAASGRATDATYEITHDGGVAQVSVDQTHNGGEWRYLGSWSFDPAGSPKVTLLGSLTGTLSADAIRFVSGDAVGGDIAYTHADQLGTIQKMTDASGSLAWDRTQRPFGETIAISAASGVANQLRFPGQYADETGLSYNYFRDYDPTLGRYLESDPIGLGGGVNTYAYVGGNPVIRTDTFGLEMVTLGETMDDIFDAGPIDTFTAGVFLRPEAERGALDTGLIDDPDGGPGRNGAQDAYRHCLWSCLIAKWAGEEDAKQIADNHEDAGDQDPVWPQPPAERAMDDHNNAVGRQCSKDDKPCADSCWESYIDGKLRTLIEPAP